MEYSPQPVFYFCYYSSLSRKRAIVTEEGGGGGEKKKREKNFLDFWIFQKKLLIHPLVLAEALVNQLTRFLLISSVYID